MVNIKRSLALLGAGVLIGWGTSSWVRWARQQLLIWLWPLGPLKLDRPLVAFDIESTGLNVSKDRILELAAVKVWPDGKVEVKGPQRLNPKVLIPAEVTAIHHITQEDLIDCPSFADVAQEWRNFLEGCDLAGYNAKKFDVPMLRNEFRRAGHFNFPPLGVPVVDAFRIFCNQEPRTLSAAVSFYCGRTHSKDDAHSALGDAWATLKVLVEQVRRYGDLPRSVSELSALCAKPNRAQDITPDGKFQWRGDQPIVAFGKHSGEPLAVLIARHRDHVMWMSGQDWGDESLMLVAQALKGLLPTKEGGWEPLFDTPPPDTSVAAAAAGGNGGSRGSRIGTGKGSNHQEPQQQQQQEEAALQEGQGQLPKQQQQQQPQQEAQANSSSTTTQPPPAAAAATGTSNPHQPHQQRTDSSGKLPAPTPPEPTGWPDLLPETAAAAQNPDSWGAEPLSVSDEWSLLETVNYGGNPGPQTPRVEPEVWEGGEGGGDWQQQEQQEGGQWEQESGAWGEQQGEEGRAGEWGEQEQHGKLERQQQQQQRDGGEEPPQGQQQQQGDYQY